MSDIFIGSRTANFKRPLLSGEQSDENKND